MKSSRSQCFHCGLGIAEAETVSGVISGKQQSFCCPACLAVASTIAGGGFESYYQFRTQADKQQPVIEEESGRFAVFDDTQFQQSFVQHSGEFATTNLLIGGMHCAACVWLIENFLVNLAGVERAAVSLTEQKLSLKWCSADISLGAICQAIAAIGYQAEPFGSQELLALQQREYHLSLRRLGVAGLGMMQVGMLTVALYAGDLQTIADQYRDLLRWTSLLITTAVVFYSARPFFTAAWRGIKGKKPGMDVPVAIAITLAYTASLRATVTGTGDVYFDAVVMFTFLLLGGRFLEMRARHHASRFGADLHSLLPGIVIKFDEKGGQQSVSRLTIKKGDCLLIKPGQVISADGVLIDGYGGVDESQLTGEFELVRKTINDKLIAGTINGGSALTMRVESTGADLQIEAINELLNSGRRDKPKIEQLADSIASYFIAIVLTVAIATYVFWMMQNPQQAFWTMLSVLVVSCPCALSLATPTVITAATNRLRRLGLLVTNPQVWEMLAGITHVICDKTGTLTVGKLSVSRVVTKATLSESQCLDIAAALEYASEHPIAIAFKQEQAPPVTEQLQMTVGEGIEAVITGERYRIGRYEYAAQLYSGASEKQPGTDGQWILLSHRSGPLCWFQLQDSVRSGAAELVEWLSGQGLIVEMLSGDSSGAAEKISQQLGLRKCNAGVTPKQKLDYIQQLQADGAKVLMLGDGINDVPVLAAADVSIAMTNASDLAKAQADCILLSGDLNDVSKLLTLAHQARRIIKQNLFWALCYNLAVIPMAAMGLIAPYLAALGMSLSSLLVILNALRLHRWQPNDKRVQAEPKPLLNGGAY
jgi:Cu2+-exporting ATPase